MKKFSIVLILAMLFSAMTFTSVSADSSVWDVDSGWNAMYIKGSADATVSASFVTNAANINAGASSLGSAVYDGVGALKMTYDSEGSTGALNTYGHLYAYTDPIVFENGKTYTVTGYHFLGNCGDWATAFGLGVANETNKTFEQKVTHWTADNTMTQTPVEGTYWKNFSFEFTYDSSMGDLSFYAYQRSSGWGCQAEFSVDNVQIVEKDNTSNLVTNPGFEDGKAELLVSRLWDVDNGWNAMYIKGSADTAATVSAEVVNANTTVNSGTSSLGSAVYEGDSALKLTYDSEGSTGALNTYGHLYAYTDPIAFENGKTYTVTGYHFIGNCGDWATAFGLGVANETNKTFEQKVTHWTADNTMTQTSVEGTYWKNFSFNFTYDSSMGDLSFFAYQRSSGWGCQAEFSVDSIQIISSSTQTNILRNSGFGNDKVNTVVLSRSWDVDNGWNAMYIKGSADTAATVSAEVVNANTTVNSGTSSLGSAVYEGDSALKLTYDSEGSTGALNTYGHLYAYTDPVAFENGKTYTVTGYHFLGNCGDWATAFGLGVANETNKTFEQKVTHWTADNTMTQTSVEGTYWKNFSFDFTYDSSMGNLSFFAYQRSSGWSCQAEFSVDNVMIAEKGSVDNILENSGFGKDEVSPFEVNNIIFGWNSVFIPGTGTDATVSATLSTPNDEISESSIRGAYNGQKGLTVSYNCEKGYDYYAEAGKYYIYSDILDLKDGETYTIKFKAAGVSYENGFLLGIGSVNPLARTISGFTTHNLNEGGNTGYPLTKENIGTDNNWGLYSYTYTHDAGKYPEPRIGFCARSKGTSAENPMTVVIDDVELYTNKLTTDILNTGTFEDINAKVPYIISSSGTESSYLEEGSAISSVITNTTKNPIDAKLIIAYFTADDEYTERLISIDCITKMAQPESITPFELNASLTTAGNAFYAYAFLWEGTASVKPLASSNIFEIIR